MGFGASDTLGTEMGPNRVWGSRENQAWGGQFHMGFGASDTLGAEMPSCDEKGRGQVGRTISE